MNTSNLIYLIRVLYINTNTSKNSKSTHHQNKGANTSTPHTAHNPRKGKKTRTWNRHRACPASHAQSILTALLFPPPSPPHPRYSTHFCYHHRSPKPTQEYHRTPTDKRYLLSPIAQLTQINHRVTPTNITDHLRPPITDHRPNTNYYLLLIV